MSRKLLFVIPALLGIFLLSACRSAPTGEQVNPDGSVNVTITLTDFAIESSITEFKPGVLYRFSVTNEGPSAHEFMIMPIPEHMGMGMAMEDYDEMALMMIPIEQLPPGATVQTDYAFASVPEGEVQMVCMTPGHYEAGMFIPITVK